MTDPTPIRRLEDAAGGLRVVTPSVSDLYAYPDGRRNVLSHEHPDLFTTVVSRSDDGTGRLRVGTATHVGDCEGWQFHGANGIYAEVRFETRPLTDAERAYCDEHFMFRDTETVVEFGLPNIEDLRAAIVDEDHRRLHCLEAVIEDAERRHDVLTDLQERIEREGVRAKQLDPREGIITDLEPEWHPENDHNDGKSRACLYDMAGMRKDAHLCDWRSVAGFDYAAFWGGRYRVLEVHEPHLEPYELAALDVAGYPEWTYCRECGAVGPESAFLHVDLERVDRTRRACDRCAGRKADYDGCKTYTPDNVARARDERAQRDGGQRNLAGEFGE